MWPICCGQIRLIAFNPEGAQIRKIVEHVSVDSELPRRTPAPAPPLGVADVISKRSASLCARCRSQFLDTFPLLTCGTPSGLKSGQQGQIARDNQNPNRQSRVKQLRALESDALCLAIHALPQPRRTATNIAMCPPRIATAPLTFRFYYENEGIANSHCPEHWKLQCQTSPQSHPPP